MAVAILDEADPTPRESGCYPLEAVELSIRTDRLWERILHQVLQRSGAFDKVFAQQQLPKGALRLSA